MDAAHHRFIAGELELDGVRYAPNPERLAAMRAALGQRHHFCRLAPPPLAVPGCPT